MKLKAHFSPSILLVTFCSIKAQCEPNLTLTLCVLLYQETGATSSPCHCLHRYVIKHSRTAPARNTSDSRHSLSCLSCLALSPFFHTAHIPLASCQCENPFVAECFFPLDSELKKQLEILTNHLTHGKQRPPPKSITNNNVLY